MDKKNRCNIDKRRKCEYADKCGHCTLPCGPGWVVQCPPRYENRFKVST